MIEQESQRERDAHEAEQHDGSNAPVDGDGPGPRVAVFRPAEARAPALGREAPPRQRGRDETFLKSSVQEDIADPGAVPEQRLYTDKEEVEPDVIVAADAAIDPNAMVILF